MLMWLFHGKPRLVCVFTAIFTGSFVSNFSFLWLFLWLFYFLGCSISLVVHLFIGYCLLVGGIVPICLLYCLGACLPNRCTCPCFFTSSVFAGFSWFLFLPGDDLNHLDHLNLWAAVELYLFVFVFCRFILLQYRFWFQLYY